jgi:hypothetical protein
MQEKEQIEKKISVSHSDKSLLSLHEQNKKNIATKAKERRNKLWKEIRFMEEVIKIHPDDLEALCAKLREAGVKDGKDLERPYPYLAVDFGWGLRIFPDTRVARGEMLVGTHVEIEAKLCVEDG